MNIDIPEGSLITEQITNLAAIMGVSINDACLLLLQAGLRVTNANFVGREKYIEANWLSQTDAEMATILGCKLSNVLFARKKLGLIRISVSIPQKKKLQSIDQIDDELKRSIVEQLPAKKVAEIASELGIKFAEVKHIRDEEAKRQIREANGSVSDVDMAKRFNVNWVKIRALRNQLGIKLDRNLKIIKTLEDRVHLKDLELALTEGGETMAGYIRAKELHTTRERLRQLCVSKNIPHKLEDRKPIWYINKIARDHDQVSFTDKEWVAARFAEARSLLSEFAPLVKLDLNIARRVLQFHGITWNKKAKKNASKSHEFVDLVCSNPECGGSFKRSLRTHNVALNICKKEEKDLKTFCSSKCSASRLKGKKIIGGGGKRSKVDFNWLDKNFEEFTNQEIADRFGMKPRSIANILSARGLSRKKQQPPSE